MERVGTCVKVSFGAELLLWRVQRLFFLDGEHDLSAFLLVDLGVVKYPSYTCNVSQPIFQTRNDLLAYEQAIAVAQILDESIEANNPELVIRCINFSDSCISLLPISSLTQFTRFSSSWVYSKVITVGISYYEHEKKYKDAVKLLKGLLKKIGCSGKRGYWSLRLSIDLEHMGYKNESLSVAEEGLLDPWVRAGSKLALQRRVLRLGKPPRRWKKPTFAKSIDRQIRDVHVIGRPLNCEIGTKNRYYGYDGLQCGVENLALQYYAGEGGWKGIHAESGIWMTIFGLLFWDIIFCDISDVFHTRFQTAPLDFGTDHFYLSRRDLIDSHLTNICNGMAEEILICSYESHQGISCMGVQWDQYCLSDLRAILACIGCNCLASLCRHLAQDYRSWSHGMPDLLLWRFNNGDGFRGEAKLVEVKGPRDRLSEQQRAWMLTLMDYGFNTEICRISPHTNTPMKQ